MIGSGVRAAVLLCVADFTDRRQFSRDLLHLRLPRSSERLPEHPPGLPKAPAKRDPMVSAEMIKSRAEIVAAVSKMAAEFSSMQ